MLIDQDTDQVTAGEDLRGTGRERVGRQVPRRAFEDLTRRGSADDALRNCCSYVGGDRSRPLVRRLHAHPRGRR